MSTYSMNDVYNDVKLFNTLAGNLNKVTKESIDTQITFCFEELVEAIDSFEEGDMANFVKEVCDMQVVLSGLVQKLVHYGVDMESAMKEVNANNLTKFPKELNLEDEKAAVDAGYVIVQNHSHNRFMLKDSVGKIRKPASYVPADMTHIRLGNLV